MYVYILLYYIYYIYTHKWGLTKESKGILKYYEVKIIYICHMYLLYLTNYEKYIKALSDQQLQERERESKRKRMKESGRVHERNYLYMYQILDL